MSTSRMRRGATNETIGQLPKQLPRSVNEIDSAFQVQEAIALLVRSDPHNVERIVRVPGPHGALPFSSAAIKGKAPERTDADEGEGEVDRDVWLYEHLRRLALDLSYPLVTALQEQCTRSTCPDMRAGEWLYLCAAHSTQNENECCAIDYIVHTLDATTALINSSRYFPSRMSIAPTSTKHFSSIARRLYRIFAHAYYHHREVFDQCEAETSLYARFLRLVQDYELVSADVLVIPSSQTPATETDASGAPDAEFSRGGAAPSRELAEVSNAGDAPAEAEGEETAEAETQ